MRYEHPRDEPGETLDMAIRVAATVARHFRAAIAYYPWCKDRAGLTTVPTLILVGDRDDWTHASGARK